MLRERRPVVVTRASVVVGEVEEGVAEAEVEEGMGVAVAMLLDLLMIKEHRSRGRGKRRARDQEQIIIGETSGLRRWRGAGCRDDAVCSEKTSNV